MSIKLITNFNIEQCKKILVNDAKKMGLSSERFIIRFSDSTSIRISKPINTSRYFRGVFLVENGKTILEGCFIKRKGMFIFHCCCIAFYFLFSLICLSSFFNSEPSGNKVSDFIGVLLAIFSISFTVYIIGSTQRRDEKDELVITEKIKRLLNAKEIGDDEIDDEIEK